MPSFSLSGKRCIENPSVTQLSLINKEIEKQRPGNLKLLACMFKKEKQQLCQHTILGKMNSCSQLFWEEKKKETPKSWKVCHGTKKKKVNNYLPQKERKRDRDNSDLYNIARDSKNQLNRDCCPYLHYYNLIWKNKTTNEQKKNQRTCLHLHLIWTKAKYNVKA